ncbi:MAG: thioredoxin domain-containing protein [Terriglobales bacterium]
MRVPRVCFVLALAALAAPAPAFSRSPNPAGNAALRTRLVAFLNRSLGWQGLTRISVLRLTPLNEQGVRTAVVELVKGSQHITVTCSITDGGRYVAINGQRSPLSPDPWRANRERLQLGQSPVEGSASAPVTIYEFSDLGCPPCEVENRRIQRLFGAMPRELRVVFKFYPVAGDHSWDVRAAFAAACVARDQKAEFWSFEQAVFDSQTQLTAADVARRLQSFAVAAGTPEKYYNGCIRSAAARQAVKQSLTEGIAMRVGSTPTLFINGRRIKGAISYNVLRELVAHEAELAPLYDHADPR